MVNYIFFFNEGALFPSSTVFSGRNCRGCTHATQQNLLLAATAVKCQAGIQCVLIRVTWSGSMGSLSSLPRFLLRKTDPPTSPIIVNHSCGWWLRMTTLKVRPPFVFITFCFAAVFHHFAHFGVAAISRSVITMATAWHTVEGCQKCSNTSVCMETYKRMCWWEKDAEFNMTEYTRAIPNLEKRFWRFC